MNNQEIILSEVSTPIADVEQKSDLELKDELIKLIGSKEAVLIVGAGSSKRLDYPDWQDLLMKLENLATNCIDSFKPNKKKREYNPLEYVEDIKSHITREYGDLSQYYALLDRSFEPKKYLDNGLEFHKTLVSLPFKAILTTNYDVVLEDALVVSPV